MKIDWPLSLYGFYMMKLGVEVGQGDWVGFVLWAVIGVVGVFIWRLVIELRRLNH